MGNASAEVPFVGKLCSNVLGSFDYRDLLHVLLLLVFGPNLRIVIATPQLMLLIIYFV